MINFIWKLIMKLKANTKIKTPHLKEIEIYTRLKSKLHLHLKTIILIITILRNSLYLICLALKTKINNQILFSKITSHKLNEVFFIKKKQNK